VSLRASTDQPGSRAGRAIGADFDFGCDKELIEYVLRLVGYPLTGLTSEQAVTLFWGIDANGWSTRSEMIQEMPATMTSCAART